MTAIPEMPEMDDMSEMDDNHDFYYRVFGKKNTDIWENEIREFLEENGIPLEVMGVIDEDDENDLEVTAPTLFFLDDDENILATLVKDTLDSSDMLQKEIQEFTENILGEFYPVAHRGWVADAFKEVKVCFAFSLNTDLIEEGDNWESIASLCNMLREESEGFEQSDGGMITNELGDVILIIPDEPDQDETDTWYPIVAAVREGNEWNRIEIETADQANAFVERK